MAETVFIGCADLPHGVPWPRYFSRLGFVEASALQRGPVRPAVLSKWRNAARSPGAFAVLAPLSVTHGTTPMAGAAVGDGVTSLADTAKALAASAVVFRTPPTFSPSAYNRDVIRRFFTEHAPAERFAGAARVWQPDGLWEVRTAVELAKELGVVPGVDPLVRDQTRDPPDLYATLDVPDVYFRVSGIGTGRRTLRSTQLEEIAELVEPYERAWIVFATVDPMADALRMTKLLGSLQAERDADAADSDAATDDVADDDEGALDADDDDDDDSDDDDD